MIALPGYEPEALLTAMFQQACAGIAMVNQDGYFLNANPRFCQITGYTEAELLRRTFASITFPDDLEMDLRQADRLYRGEIERYEMEKRYIRKDGSIVWICLSCSLLGPEKLGLAIIQDISPCKREQEALAQSKALFQRVISGSDEGFFDWDLVSNEMYWSDQFYSMLGLSRENDAPSFESFLLSVAEEDRERKRKAVQNAIRSGSPLIDEFRVRHGSGKYISLSCRAKPDMDARGKVIRLSGMIADITAKKRAEKTLKESQQRLMASLSAANAGVFRWDIQTNTVVWDESLAKLFGLPHSATVHWFYDFIALIHPDDRAEVRSQCEQAEHFAKDFQIEYRTVWPDGSLHWLYSKGTTFLDDYHQPSYMMGACVDITARKQAEEALKASEEHFRFVTDTVPVMIWLTDEKLDTIYINHPWLEFTGQPFEEIMGMGWLNRIHPDDRAGAGQSFIESARQREKVRIEYRLQRKDGVYCHMSDVGAPLLYPDGSFQGYIGYVIDITERKQAEDAVYQSEENWRVMANSIPQLAWMADAQGQIFWFNQRYYEYTGASFEELEGEGWIGLIHPGQAESVVSKIEQVKGTGKALEATFLFRGKEGQYRWFLARALPIRNAQGQVTRWFGTSTDVTELQEIQEALQQSEKQLAISNRDLEQFAAIASHDLQAPLRKAKSFCDMIHEQVKDKLDPETLDLMERVHGSLENMQTLITDLLLLSKISREHPAFKSVDLSEVLREVLLILSDLIQETGATIHIGPMETVYGDSAQLAQLLQNLIQNALKYQPPGQKPIVEIQAVCLENQMCQISVTDNGIGFSPDQAERIFKPFERLHGKTSPYSGTGIGLAICQRIVERHEGCIQGQSQPGHGATFTVLLPKYASDRKTMENRFQFV